MALDTRSTKTVRVGPAHDRRLPGGHRPPPDYCDQCGATIPTGCASAPRRSLPRSRRSTPRPRRASEPCPACGAARSGDDRFCEGCGHDFLERAGPARVGGGGAAPTATNSSGTRARGCLSRWLSGAPLRARRLGAAHRAQPRAAGRGSPGDRPRRDAGGSGDLPSARRARAAARRRPTRSATSARRTARRSTTTRRRSAPRAAPLSPRRPHPRSGRGRRSPAPALRSRSRPSEVVRGEHASAEDDRHQAGALLVLGQLADAETLEQNPQVGLHRVDAEEHLGGDLGVRRRWSRSSSRPSAGTGRSAPCAASRRGATAPGDPWARAVESLPSAPTGSW